MLEPPPNPGRFNSHYPTAIDASEELPALQLIAIARVDQKISARDTPRSHICDVFGARVHNTAITPRSNKKRIFRASNRPVSCAAFAQECCKIETVYDGMEL
ncbi:UNVERIFIED_ORG: hypothetical protein ABIC54_006061 [Burkholderia sp. 1263]